MDDQIKILMIEDEEKIINLVHAYVKAEGYEFLRAQDGIVGLQIAESMHPHLIILDIMLPGMDGVEILSRLRRQSDVYIIMLTAMSEEMDKINSLTLGADDYMTKPFSPRELMARIKSGLRRLFDKNPQDNALLIIDELCIDSVSHQIFVDDLPIPLTSLEFDLIKTLAINRGRAFTREQLLNSIWGVDYYGDPRVVDVHVGHIRQKLGKNKWIETVRGIGYRFSK